MDLRLSIPWKRSSPDVVAVDVDARFLRLALARGPGLPRIAALERVPLPAGMDRNDAGAVGAFIGLTLRERGLAGLPGLMAVPRSHAVLKSLSLPGVVEARELPGLVRFQVEKDLPFRVTEAVVDFTAEASTPASRPTSTPPSAHANGNGSAAGGGGATSATTASRRVLAAAVRQAVLEQYLQVASAAGLRLQRLGLRPYADIRCLAACRAVSPPTIAPDIQALIHLTGGEAEIDVVADGSLVFSRSVLARWPEAQPASQPASEPAPTASATPTPLATNASPAAPASPAPPAPDSDPDHPRTVEEAIQRLVTDIARTLRTLAATQGDGRAQRVWVAGDTGAERSVADGLARQMGVPCEPLAPASWLDLPQGGGEDRGRGFVTALGLAIEYHAAGAQALDFLHPRRPPVERNTPRTRAIQAAVAAGVIAIAGVSYGVNQRLAAERRADQLLATFNELEKRARSLKPLEARARAVEEWERLRLPWLDHWAHLAALMPPAQDVCLTALRTYPDQTLAVTVKARGSSVITTLQRSLAQAGYEVRLGAESTQKDELGYTHVVTLRLGLGSALRKGAAIDVAKLRASPRPTDDGSTEWVRKAPLQPMDSLSPDTTSQDAPEAQSAQETTRSDAPARPPAGTTPPASAPPTEAAAEPHATESKPPDAKVNDSKYRKDRSKVSNGRG